MQHETAIPYFGPNFGHSEGPPPSAVPRDYCCGVADSSGSGHTDLVDAANAHSNHGVLKNQR
jgi:hypothetical protein